MDLKELLEEISSAELSLTKIGRVIDKKEQYGCDLVVSVSNDLSTCAPANVDCLYEALKTEQSRLTDRLKTLRDAEAVAKKVLSGLLKNS